MRLLRFHDPAAGLAVLDETLSTRGLGGTAFGGSHTSTSAFFHGITPLCSITRKSGDGATLQAG
jgi:hypothetical protein